MLQASGVIALVIAEMEILLWRAFRESEWIPQDHVLDSDSLLINQFSYAGHKWLRTIYDLYDRTKPTLVRWRQRTRKDSEDVQHTGLSCHVIEAQDMRARMDTWARMPVRTYISEAYHYHVTKLHSGDKISLGQLIIFPLFLITAILYANGCKYGSFTHVCIISII